jgi:hypothetical protein
LDAVTCSWRPSKAVTDPAGSDLEVGQSSLLAPEQVEKL